jgi:hypothetical protein
MSFFVIPFFFSLKARFNHSENTMVQTNFDFIVCHVFDNVNIDLIPTGKSEFIFYISWKSNIGDVVNLVYIKKKQVLTQNENTCTCSLIW